MFKGRTSGFLPTSLCISSQGCLSGSLSAPQPGSDRLLPTGFQEALPHQARGLSHPRATGGFNICLRLFIFAPCSWFSSQESEEKCAFSEHRCSLVEFCWITKMVAGWEVLLGRISWLVIPSNTNMGDLIKQAQVPNRQSCSGTEAASFVFQSSVPSPELGTC